MFCNKFPSVPSLLHLSPTKILGKVLYFILPPYPEIIKVRLAKISFYIIPLANTTEEKPRGGGRFRPPLGARRVKT